MKSKTPLIYKNTYTDSILNYLLVYNVFSKKNPTLLNKPLAYLFKLVDGKRSLYDIYLMAKKKDPLLKFSRIKEIFNDFLNLEIVYFNLPNLQQIFTRKEPKRLSIWFHITNQCNLRCKHCFINKTPNKISMAMAQTAFNKIFADAKKNKYNQIKIFFSGGECLLELKKLINLIKLGKRLSKKTNIEIAFSIATNGTLITPKIAKTLALYTIEVAISLDGLQKFNDSQRVFSNGLGTFKYIEQAIKNLKKYHVPYRAIVTVTTNNVANLPSLTKYFLINKIPFSINFYRESPYSKKGLTPTNKILINYLKKSYQILYKYVPKYRLIDDVLDRVNFRVPRLAACAVGDSYIVITHEGKLASCPMIIDRSIGSINDQDIVKTMRNKSFIKPRGLTVEKKIPCNHCQWKYVCCGGCPLLAYETKKTYKSSSPYCEVYKTLIPEVLKIEAKRLIKYGFNKERLID